MSKFSFMLEAMGDSLNQLPTVESQYNDLWKFAQTLKKLGIPLEEWHPSAKDIKEVMSNKAFDASGVTAAALEIAKNEKQDYPDIRHIGVWNGKEKVGGALFRTTLVAGNSPCNMDMDAREVEELKSTDAVLELVKATIEIWSPNMVQVAPYAYKSVFEKRVSIGWMAYLPHAIETTQAPEASRLIPIMGDRKKQKGTIVVSVNEIFDPKNPEHVKRANDLEIRLADQDLLPKYVDCYSH